MKSLESTGETPLVTAHLADVKTNFRFDVWQSPNLERFYLQVNCPPIDIFLFIVSANAAQVIDKLEENGVLVDAFT